MRACYLSLMITCLTATALYSQEPFRARTSPLALAQVRYKDAYIKITYSQPLKRGRKIFGTVVPFGSVWRTGANESTEITITRDILINNLPLKAGTYSIYTIPDDGQWTIIINADVGQWGAYNYASSLDVHRFQVPVVKTQQTTEALTILLDPKNELADLLILWDDVKVSISIKFLN